jgi:hypothetical protein
MKYALAQLQRLAADVGFPDPSLAASVAYAESGGDPCAQGDPNIGVHPCSGPNGTSTSFGLWQIHTPAHPEYDPTRLLRDPTYNARAAYAISRGGTDWAPWSTFNKGINRPYNVPFSPAPLPTLEPTATPPLARPRAPALLVAAGALALAGAAGYAARETRRRRFA